MTDREKLLWAIYESLKAHGISIIFNVDTHGNNSLIVDHKDYQKITITVDDDSIRVHVNNYHIKIPLHDPTFTTNTPDFIDNIITTIYGQIINKLTEKTKITPDPDIPQLYSKLRVLIRLADADSMI